MRLVYCFAIACLLTFLLTPYFRLLAIRWKVVDLPNRRKIHKRAMPLLGGVPICLSVLFCALLKPFILGKGWPVLLGGTLIMVINVFDDIKGLSARLRFILETLVTLGVIIGGVRLTFLPAGFWGDAGEILLTVIWFVGVTNAFNYLDGLDGLAVGAACINFCGFGVILYLTGQLPLGFLSLILLGSCLGFLPHNFPKAKIFLGDAGSTFLGFMLAGIAIVGDWAADSVAKICIPILILGVPIFDMIFTTIMRVKEKKVTTIVEWLKYGGKDHFHHYLVNLGFHPNGAVLFIWAIMVSLGLSGVMLNNDTAVEGVLTMLQASIIFAVIGVLIVVGKRHRGVEMDQGSHI